MNPQSLAFRRNLTEQVNNKKTPGKIIILSGISGAGKSLAGDILVTDYNYIYINKYITRDFRNKEKEAIQMGKNIGIQPVIGKYNEADDKTKKEAFFNLKLLFSYINYDDYYGFSKNEIDNYLANGRNVVIIINDITIIRDLKNIYKENCLSIYIHRANPKNKDIFMQIAKQRGDTPESAEKRYQKAIKDFDRYTNNISLYDYTILNTDNNTNRLSQILQDLTTRNVQSMQTNKLIRQGNNPKLYVFIGNPGSGKNEAIKIIRTQNILHSIIMPKHTTRARKESDGEEMICFGEELFDMDSCSLTYDNFGNIYGIDIQELHQRIEDGISSSLVVSNAEAIKKLKEEFPNELVTIYIHGLSKEEYMLQQKDHLEDEYVKNHLMDYNQADEFYHNHCLEFNHVVIYNGDLTDLKLQIDNIMRYYEEGRDFSIDNVDKYLETAYRYIEKY